MEEMESATQQLNEAWNDASQDMYNAQQEAAASTEDGDSSEAEDQDDTEEVTDVDYEVVEDDAVEDESKS